VHTFFMHLGAARDYLASLIALRIGKNPQKADSMANLIDVTRTSDFGSDALLDHLESKGYLQQSPAGTGKIESAGWLKKLTERRNEFVHRRPYGSKFTEQKVVARVIDGGSGLYRYVRTYLCSDGAEHDILDLMVDHYETASILFLECAEKSGYDSSVITLTEKDLISAEFYAP
jgi:hypothetical protein